MRAGCGGGTGTARRVEVACAWRSRRYDKSHAFALGSARELPLQVAVVGKQLTVTDELGKDGDLDRSSESIYLLYLIPYSPLGYQMRVVYQYLVWPRLAGCLEMQTGENGYPRAAEDSHVSFSSTTDVNGVASRHRASLWGQGINGLRGYC